MRLGTHCRLNPVRPAKGMDDMNRTKEDRDQHVDKFSEMMKEALNER